jgi:hypothetical protein
MVLPGEYVVKLVVPAATTSLVAATATETRVTLLVNRDPRVTISDEDMRARHRALMDVYQAQLDGVPAGVVASDLNTQMTAVSKAIGEIKDVKPEVKTAVAEAARKIRDVQSGVSRAMSRLTSAGRDVAASTSLPTEAQRLQIADALEQLRASLPRVKDLQSIVVPAFNKALDDLGVAAGVPRLKPPK